MSGNAQDTHPLPPSQIRWGEDKNTGDFKGYCHLEFKDAERLDKAVALSGTSLMGRRVRVDYAAQKEKVSLLYMSHVCVGRGHVSYM